MFNPFNAPKVIDLDKYGISNMILSLFAQGGGSGNSDGLNFPWDKLSVEKPTYVQFTIGEDDYTKVPVNVVGKKSTGEVHSLLFNTPIFVSNNLITANFIINSYGESGCQVYVKI